MDHACLDAVDPSGTDITVRLDERLKFVVNAPVAIQGQNGDLDDPVAVVDAGRLDIDDRNASVATNQMLDPRR
ncbi:hypothetical protein AVZ31_11680 [Mycolicibacterium neoaurum]|uniref:Uncharacterized protein n=1 Tax=Mycolicibacterium neoaurum VKM Ac-1815D TaxID=700508 RepID=V5XJQ4_MYCNE|nr:hypothetical protein AVZ31_11680 [Mycolicibacterium neoaurum]